jgi:hypothetical protein
MTDRRKVATSRDDDSGASSKDLELSDLVITAQHEVQQVLLPPVFNHSMRVLHLALHLAGRRVPGDRDALAVAALFHDAGTADSNNGYQRFELEGADAAAKLLESWGWPPERVRPVWVAIALHTSAGIAERFGNIAQVLRTAVLVDLRRTNMPVPSTPELTRRLAMYPRLRIESLLPEVVIRQALEPGKEMKAPPYTWPGCLVAGQRAGERTSVAHRSSGHSSRTAAL